MSRPRSVETVLAVRSCRAGDPCSAADVHIGSRIGRGLMVGTLRDRPVLCDRRRQIGGRAARARATALDAEAMGGDGNGT
jgi:hypothetical protein